ncbi:substrate-binding domain-containing protein [Bdellovibrio sp. SKB1291214]|uniref:ABC transporter substrate-binding protein n=1 Tax=Bdellovibrio sp. SKB1291214 TaxID=1732569 RepID=UPI000B51D208|nr:substrate-binding domain-containing protein [Bdellovibrio sp. SKB1291214]UYL07470.1 substrate-binding domain-containing protein [Bdellovibrio sp. SKB1291214]
MNKLSIFVNQQARILETVFKLFMTSCLLASVAKALPDNGPQAQPNKKILFIASNLRNGGVKSVSESFKQAGHHLKWQVDIADCGGQKSCVLSNLKKALKDVPDGIVLGGFDGADFRDTLKKARKKSVKVVGWHAAAKSGPTSDMFTNITTDPIAVAHTAAAQVLNYGAKTGGVIILTDRDYSIATTKTLAMKKAIEAMPNFKLIAVEDVAIAHADKEIPHLIKAWNQRYGKSWTHTLAINDLYFDMMAPSLKAIHREDVVGIAAGDGSVDGIARVDALKSPQLVTVAEPLQTQGWQLADELNRALAGEPASDYKTQVLVISKTYMDGLKSGDIEESIPYQSSYLKIWYPDTAKEKTLSP